MHKLKLFKKIGVESDQIVSLSDLEYLSLVATFASHFATPLESESTKS